VRARLDGVKRPDEWDELDIELDRLRAIECQWNALPDHVRAESSVSK